MKLFDKIRTWFTGQKSSESLPLALETILATKPNWNTKKVLESFTENEWLFACTSLIAQEVAKVEIKLFKDNSKGEPERVFDHPALRILEKPNPIDTGMDHSETTQIQQELTGNGYWYLQRGAVTADPMEAWIMRPDLVATKVAGDGSIEYYEFTGEDGRTKRLPPEDVVHFKYPNPLSLYTGTPQIKSSSVSISTDLKAALWNYNFFKNSATPNFILFIKEMGEPAKKRFENKWNERYQGEQNAHRVGLIDDPDAKVHEFGNKQKDMDFVNQGTALRDKILGNQRTPRDLLGLGQNSNRASIEGSTLIFSRFTIEPKVRRKVNKLNQDLLPQFRNSEGLYYDYDDPVPEDKEWKLSMVKTAVQDGWITVNEARLMFGLEAVEWGDAPARKGTWMDDLKDELANEE